MNLEKLNPWNWFKKEDAQRSGTVLRPREDGSTEALSPILRVQRDMDRLFDQLLQGFPGNQRLLAAYPKLDLSESEKEYQIELELPGLTRDEVELLVEDDALVIHGRHERKSEDTGRHYHRIERSFGSFQRILNLPPDADQENVIAKMDDGVLRVTIPRLAEAKSQGRRVTIG